MGELFADPSANSKQVESNDSNLNQFRVLRSTSVNRHWREEQEDFNDDDDDERAKMRPLLDEWNSHKFQPVEANYDEQRLDDKFSKVGEEKSKSKSLVDILGLNLAAKLQTPQVASTEKIVAKVNDYYYYCSSEPSLKVSYDGKRQRRDKRKAMTNEARRRVLRRAAKSSSSKCNTRRLALSLAEAGSSARLEAQQATEVEQICTGQDNGRDNQQVPSETMEGADSATCFVSVGNCLDEAQSESISSNNARMYQGDSSESRVALDGLSRVETTSHAYRARKSSIPASASNAQGESLSDGRVQQAAAAALTATTAALNTSSSVAGQHRAQGREMSTQNAIQVANSSNNNNYNNGSYTNSQRSESNTLASSRLHPWRHALHPDNSSTYKLFRHNQQQQQQLQQVDVSVHLDRLKPLEQCSVGGHKEVEDGGKHGHQSSLAISGKERKISRYSRPGRSPISLQRQTNQRLARHKLKIQQQRHEQIAQLMLREQEQHQHHQQQQQVDCRYQQLTSSRPQQLSGRYLQRATDLAQSRPATAKSHSLYLINGLLDRIPSSTIERREFHQTSHQNQPQTTNSECRLTLDFGLIRQSQPEQVTSNQQAGSASIQISDNQLACSSRQSQHHTMINVPNGRSSTANDKRARGK